MVPNHALYQLSYTRKQIVSYYIVNADGCQGVFPLREKNHLVLRYHEENGEKQRNKEHET